MFTAGLIAALISAAVAGATAIGKGVQAHKQKKERKEEQSKVTEAMGTAAGQTAAFREQSKEQSMEGLRHSMAQMQPLQDAMSRAYGGAGGPGYQQPDMSWLNQQPRPDSGQGGGGNEPRANVGGPPPPGGTVRSPLSPYGAPANSPLGGVMQAGQDKWGHSAGGLHRR